MVTIKASGTARVDGVGFPEQAITVTGEGNSIRGIAYDEYIIGFVADAFVELLDNPVGYWACPEIPVPHTMKSAYVALSMLFDHENVVIDGIDEIDEAQYDSRVGY